MCRDCANKLSSYYPQYVNTVPVRISDNTMPFIKCNVNLPSRQVNMEDEIYKSHSQLLLLLLFSCTFASSAEHAVKHTTLCFIALYIDTNFSKYINISYFIIFLIRLGKLMTGTNTV